MMADGGAAASDAVLSGANLTLGATFTALGGAI